MSANARRAHRVMGQARWLSVKDRGLGFPPSLSWDAGPWSGWLPLAARAR